MNKYLAKKVKEQYGLTIRSSKNLSRIPSVHVSKIITDQGIYLLKGKKEQKSRMHYIRATQQHLHKKKVLIPREYPTVSGKPYFVFEKKSYILQEWIKGKSPTARSQQNILKLGSLIGRFHQRSLEFSPPVGCRAMGALDWENKYQADIKRIKQWYRRHHRSHSLKIKWIVRYCKRFIARAEWAYKTLLAYPFYHQWKSYPDNQHYLCHGDYHPRNTLLHKATHYLIDWEHVCHDFVSKDISRMHFMIMRKHKSFCKSRFKAFLQAYQQENPLQEQELGLLYIDLSFPHIFERFIRKRLYHKMNTKEVAQFVTYEWKKTLYMCRKAKLYC
ncbi:spore coat protein [Brevibacillus laterosporus]|uniref:Spore coat protein n=1 Tax=Brevibacillus laterosporus TaxID=1465 RepID=A0A518VBU7_BRELA|nr:spore coat protein [Brevibacillus laterosporus]